MKYAIIVAEPPHAVYFLFDSDGETTYFESFSDCEKWIEKNARPVSDYFIWDVVEGCIIF